MTEGKEQEEIRRIAKEERDKRRIMKIRHMKLHVKGKYMKWSVWTEKIVNEVDKRKDE